MWSHTTLSLSAKDTKLNFLTDIILLFKMKLLFLIVLVYRLYIRQMREGHRSFISWSFCDILLLENDFSTYSYQIYMHPFFTLCVIIELNNLKYVFCHTLLQSSSTLQPKQNSLLISAIPQNKNGTVHYVRDKIHLQISKWKAMGVLWYLKKSTLLYSHSVWRYCRIGRAVLLQQDKDPIVITPIFLELLVPTFSTE